jgi:hypothetical protein
LVAFQEENKSSYFGLTSPNVSFYIRSFVLLAETGEMEHQKNPEILNSNREGGGEGEGVAHFAGTSPRTAATTSGIRKRRGAAPGNQQAFKHGRYAKETLGMLKTIADHTRLTRALLKIGEAELAAREGREPRKRIRIRFR